MKRFFIQRFIQMFDDELPELTLGRHSGYYEKLIQITLQKNADSIT